jgi:hypothetical protein
MLADVFSRVNCEVNRRVSRGLTIAVLLLVVSSASLYAQSSVRVRPGTNIGSPGAALTLAIEVVSDVPVTGFSFGMTHSAPLFVPAVSPSSRLTGLIGGAPDADFFVVDTTPSGGSGFIVALILAPGDGAPTIPTGTTHVLDVTYSVAQNADAATTVRITNTLSADPGAPNVDLVVDVDNGTGRTFSGSSAQVEFVDGFLRGDADLSGTRSGNFRTALTVTDAVVTLQYLFAGGAPPVCLDAADADDSGSLSLTDGLVILNFLFRNGVAPAPPFPNPGLDPTEDGLDCSGIGL